MLDELTKPEDTEAAATDYLGRPSPVAFKNQPALPSGGGSIGVGAGPATSTTGTGVNSVKRAAALTDFLTSLGITDPNAGGGGPGGGGDASSGTPATGSITGFDPTTANIGVSVTSAALGVPGLAALIGTLAGVPAFAQGIPSVASEAITAGKAATSVAGKAGLSPSSDLTMATPEGPVSVAPTYTGLFSALLNAIKGEPNFVGIDPSTGQMTTAPSFGPVSPGYGPNVGLGQAGTHGTESLGGAFPNQNSPANRGDFGQAPNAFGRDALAGFLNSLRGLLGLDEEHAIDTNAPPPAPPDPDPNAQVDLDAANANAAGIGVDGPGPGSTGQGGPGTGVGGGVGGNTTE